MVGSGNSILADVRDVDLSGFEAVWASPPCQEWSQQNHGNGTSKYGDADLLWWSLSIQERYPNIQVLWVENVMSDKHDNSWGTKFNAVQFLPTPIQKRRRVVGGSFKMPMVYRPFQWNYPDLDICPAVLASEYKQGSMARDDRHERRKATRWYTRPLSLREMAYHQGFDIPDGLLKSWFHVPPAPDDFKPTLSSSRRWKAWCTAWDINLSEAIGNGVPVYMARAFGEAYSQPGKGIRQLSLLAEVV